MKAGESQEVKSARLAYGVTNKRATGTALGDKRTSQNNASSHSPRAHNSLYHQNIHILGTQFPAFSSLQVFPFCYFHNKQPLWLSYYYKE